jgi:hypothetical protein
MTHGRDTDGTDREKRWVALASDGRHAWLGRHSDPSDNELVNVSRSLSEAGLGAWLCIGEGVYWSSGPYTLLEVRRLAEGGEFESAKAAFLHLRQQAMATLSQEGQ